MREGQYELGKTMKDVVRYTSWIVGVIICIAGCTSLVQRPCRDAEEVVRVALTDFFSQGNPSIPPPETGTVRIHCPALGKSKQLEIPGVKNVVVPREEAQLDNPNPKGYWIRVYDLRISGDEARFGFYAKSAKYHKWLTVSYKLWRSGNGWKATLTLEAM